MEIHDVEVLLATYNGEVYLETLLQSIASQREVRVHLRVSDDGSTDRTVEIIKRHRKSFESLYIHNGPGKGPKDNFLYLISKSQRKFVALADQDDVWEKNHLINSLSRLEVNKHTPAISFSAVEEIDSIGNSKQNIWPKIDKAPRLQNVLFENYARGCTIVMNRKFIDLISQKKENNAIMHDWWILIIALACGKVEYSTNPEVRYRIHADNFVGPKRKLSVKFLSIFKTFRTRNWSILSQLEEIYSAFRDEIKPEAKLQILELLKLNEKGLLARIKLLYLANINFAKIVSLTFWSRISYSVRCTDIRSSFK